MENVVLVGPMGAGKSTIGRGLAAVLKRSFVDADAEIEKRTGVDIPTIFEFEGEEGFRQRETEMLRELLERENIVLATGGGAVMRPENRELLKQHCVLYLRVPVTEQFRRTRKSRRRPLLNAAGDPRKRLEELFRVRDPLYQEVATIVLQGRNQRVRDAVRAACEALQARRPDLCPLQTRRGEQA
ncbi:shikimate kinase [Thioalkalivibrio paradoxus]|uniref:Shikimate kinase n=1 Tax=Thioalkalivibrio paradoxus ARh 1 TaxID=713585 RepID=W0DQ26_9GAMM|nr:shikimate kinase [Thioalkalivibrio paradoxus]AHE99347.1 shikimate kinase [Thioalkalivibrio paradoxus ARh 1]